MRYVARSTTCQKTTLFMRHYLLVNLRLLG